MCCMAAVFMAGVIVHAASLNCNPNSAKPDQECAVIPKEGCFGCMKGEPQMIVNAESAKKIMTPRKTMCMAEFKALKSAPARPSVMDPSCNFHVAVCKDMGNGQGKCVGKTLSKDEIAKVKAQMQQKQSEGGGQQGNEDQDN